MVLTSEGYVPEEELYSSESGKLPKEVADKVKDALERAGIKDIDNLDLNRENNKNDDEQKEK